MVGTPRRRKDRQRMKAKARRLRPWDEQGRCADHLAQCSCWACGNPRKHFGQKTVQEQRADEADDFWDEEDLDRDDDTA